MGTPRAQRPRRTALIAAAGIITLALSACATDAPKTSAAPASAPGSSSAAPTSESPSAAPTSEAPTPEAPASEAPPETPSPAPTSEAPPVNQPTVVYTKAASSVGPGENVKVTITVQTPNPGVPHGDATLVVDGANYASATLDANGNLVFTLKGLSAGDHSYKAVFAGNETYVASESKAKKIRVMTEQEVAEAQKKKEEQAAAAANNPCPVTAEACVDLTNNTTWLQKDGVITAGPFKQIGGRAGHRTPTGTFKVTWKNIDHKSKEFNNAPMPYAIFFNNQGMAFHVGSLNTPSHGCIRITQSTAQIYWAALQPGDVVYIFGTPNY